MIKLKQSTAPSPANTFGLFFDWDNDGTFERYVINDATANKFKYGYSDWNGGAGTWGSLTAVTEKCVVYTTATWSGSTYGILKFAIADANHNNADDDFTFRVASDEVDENPYWHPASGGHTNSPSTESSSQDFTQSSVISEYPSFIIPSSSMIVLYGVFRRKAKKEAHISERF